jgi:hypothetical protein
MSTGATAGAQAQPRWTLIGVVGVLAIRAQLWLGILLGWIYLVAIGIGAVALMRFRLASRLLHKWDVPMDAEVAAILALGCWAALPLLAEPLLQWRKLRRA